MKCTLKILLCLAGIFLDDRVLAQDVKVRTSVETNDTIWVGQRVAFVVELLAPGFFSSAATFDLPDPEGALLMPPMEHPVVSSETIDGVGYTVQRYELAVFAARAGGQTVPALTVRFSYKRNPLDTNDVPASVTTTPVHFVAAIPPGAENLGNVISARNLDVEESWRPDPGKTNVPAGTAFTRTITFTAPDVPGMIFPPFPAGRIDGLGIYLKAAVLDDVERGVLNGKRRDTITYVCQRAGSFTIPAARLTWFDLDAKALRTNVFPARTFTVIANPALASAATAAGMGKTSVVEDLEAWWKPGVLVFVIILILTAGESVPGRRLFTGLLAELRPVHLQPLNPEPPPK